MVKSNGSIKWLILISILLALRHTGAQHTMMRVNPSFATADRSRVRINEQYSYIFKPDSGTSGLVLYPKQLPFWLKYDSVTRTLSGRSAKAGQYPVEMEAGLPHVASDKFMLTVYDKKTTAILCLGNSITNGTGKYNSYRRALWQQLHNAHYNFDFIGSWDKHNLGSDIPDPDFDLDHEGHSGWSFADVLLPPAWDSARGNIYKWLQSYTPDIVLMELGTNDVFQCRRTDDIIADLLKLVQTLREDNHEVKICIAQIPPLGQQWSRQKLCGNNTAYDQAIQELNKAIGIFCRAHSLKKSPLVPVDQYSGVIPAFDMYDDIHPSEEGEKKMANKWFASIRRFLKKLN